MGKNPPWIKSIKTFKKQFDLFRKSLTFFVIFNYESIRSEFEVAASFNSSLLTESTLMGCENETWCLVK